MQWHLNKALGIIVAVRDEVKDILENPFFAWKEEGKNIYHCSQFNIWLVISGIGKANASCALGRIIDKVGEVWIVGTSGGLGNEETGSMYISTEFVEHDMDASGLGFPKGVTPFSEMKEFVIKHPSVNTANTIETVCTTLKIPVNYGRTMSGDQFINDSELVKRKKMEFGVHIVDMESAAVAKICQREGIPVLALRTISDNANHEAGDHWVEFVKLSSKNMNLILQHLVSEY